MKTTRNIVLFCFLLLLSLNSLGQEVRLFVIGIVALISDVPFWQSWWFYYLIILIGLSIAILLYRARMRQIKATQMRQLDAERLRTRMLDSELKALRSQMNPHFIFNSLNSIQELVLREDKALSYDYIVLFSKLVRYTLNYSNNDFISIAKELEFLAVYLSLEKLRFESDFEYTIAYTGSKDIAVPLMLVQPFIENAMRHGLFHKKGLKRLEISFEFTDQLICIVKDNGIGQEAAKKIQQRQQGTDNSPTLSALEQRLDLINKQMGQKIGSFSIIDLYADEKVIGTKVEIILPFKPYNLN